MFFHFWIELLELLWCSWVLQTLSSYRTSRKGGLASETPKLLWVSQETVKMSKTQSVPGKSQAKVELELKL